MAKTKSILIAAGCLGFALAGQLAAQNNAAEIYGGYSYMKANPIVTLDRQSMNGWVASAVGYPGAKWFGVGFEIGANFGSIGGPTGGTALNFKEYSYLVGPQFRFLDKEKVQSSFKFLLGGAFGQARLPSQLSAADSATLGAAGYSAFDQTKFAMLMAVPVDYTITKTIGIRFEPGIYVSDFSKTKQSNFRFSVGPVFRFGGGR